MTKSDIPFKNVWYCAENTSFLIRNNDKDMLYQYIDVDKKTIEYIYIPSRQSAIRYCFRKYLLGCMWAFYILYIASIIFAISTWHDTSWMFITGISILTGLMILFRLLDMKQELKHILDTEIYIQKEIDEIEILFGRVKKIPLFFYKKYNMEEYVNEFRKET